MTGTQKKIAAVAVVLVIIVAGAAVYYFAGHRDSGSSAEKLSSELLIYGNANEDLVLDQDDMTLIQEIVNGSKDPQDYPLADANQDGRVTADDLIIVSDLIAGNSTTVYVQCLDLSGETVAVAASYPLRNAVPYGTNIIEPFLYIGGGEFTAGYFKSLYPVLEHSMSQAVDLMGGKRDITDAAWSNFMRLDTSLQAEGGVGALLVDYSARAALKDTYVTSLQEAGIPMIVYASADPVQEIATALTLGFLCGKTTEKTGLAYAQTSMDIYNAIQAKIAGMADSDKVDVISLNMYIYVCQNDSTFNQSPEYVGAVPYYKGNDAFAEDYAGTGSTKMQTTEALANYDDADYLISNRSLDVGQKDIAQAMVEIWDKYAGYFENLKDYQGLVYINNLLPGACRLAYLAAALYPTLFSDSWADGCMQEFLDGNYVPLKGQTLDTVFTSFDYDDYTAAKS